LFDKTFFRKILFQLEITIGNTNKITPGAERTPAAALQGFSRRPAEPGGEARRFVKLIHKELL